MHITDKTYRSEKRKVQSDKRVRKAITLEDKECLQLFSGLSLVSGKPRHTTFIEHFETLGLRAQTKGLKGKLLHNAIL